MGNSSVSQTVIWQLRIAKERTYKGFLAAMFDHSGGYHRLFRGLWMSLHPAWCCDPDCLSSYISRVQTCQNHQPSIPCFGLLNSPLQAPHRNWWGFKRPRDFYDHMHSSDNSNQIFRWELAMMKCLQTSLQSGLCNRVKWSKPWILSISGTPLGTSTLFSGWLPPSDSFIRYECSPSDSFIRYEYLTLTWKPVG